jgi:prepilin-type N-terminal cleavage/methylation domain-containing protein
MTSRSVRHGARAPSGFTLLEVLIAAVLFAVGITATLSAIDTASGLVEHEGRVTQALHIAEGNIEELLLRPRESADPTPGPHTGRVYDSRGIATSPGVTGAFAPVYSTTWTVTTGALSSRLVTLTVTWTGRAVGANSISLSTNRT